MEAGSYEGLKSSSMLPPTLLSPMARLTISLAIGDLYARREEKRMHNAIAKYAKQPERRVFKSRYKLFIKCTFRDGFAKINERYLLQPGPLNPTP